MTDVDGARDDGAIDRRADGRIIEIDHGLVQRRLGLRDLRLVDFVLRHGGIVGGLGRVQIALRDEIAPPELLVPLESSSRVVDSDFAFGEIGLTGE